MFVLNKLEGSGHGDIHLWSQNLSREKKKSVCRYCNLICVNIKNSNTKSLLGALMYIVKYKETLLQVLSTNNEQFKREIIKITSFVIPPK